NAYQRDYIYYGITKENKPGTLNRYIREKLYRFRIAANAYSAINDPTQYRFFLSDRIFLMGDKKSMGVIGIDIYA
ncbi:hypothetical protein, partial [Bacteroides intestinalis]|uniref:hypothetical protein n=1 Tax=Bacteroides intestinalis TaxID=329854 RepID=UPI0005CA6293